MLPIGIHPSLVCNEILEPNSSMFAHFVTREISRLDFFHYKRP